MYWAQHDQLFHNYRTRETTYRDAISYFRKVSTSPPHHPTVPFDRVCTKTLGRHKEEHRAWWEVGEKIVAGLKPRPAGIYGIPEAVSSGTETVPFLHSTSVSCDGWSGLSGQKKLQQDSNSCSRANSHHPQSVSASLDFLTNTSSPETSTRTFHWLHLFSMTSAWTFTTTVVKYF